MILMKIVFAVHSKHFSFWPLAIVNQRQMIWRYDTQHNDIQHNDTQHNQWNDIQHNNK